MLVYFFNGSENMSLDPSFSMSWHERLVSWSGWEKLYERRFGVIVVLLCVVSLLLGIGWLVTRRQNSSVGNIMWLEQCAQTFRKSEENPDYTKILVRMNDMVPRKGELADRFSGVIVQEQLVQSLAPSAERCSVTSTLLTKAQLPTYAELLSGSIAAVQGKNDEALQTIDSTLAHASSLSPRLHFYLLVQKAHLLAGKLDSAFFDNLQQIATELPESFDRCFPNGVNHFVQFLRETHNVEKKN